MLPLRNASRHIETVVEDAMLRAELLPLYFDSRVLGEKMPAVVRSDAQRARMELYRRCLLRKYG